MTQRTALSGSTSNAVGRFRRIEVVPSGTGATYVLRPVADVSGVATAEANGWTPTPAGATAWDKLDDAVLQPAIGSPATDDYIRYSGTSVLSYVGRLGGQLGFALGETVTSVTLWVQSNLAGTAVSFTISLLKGDGTALVTSAADGATGQKWTSITYTGALSESQVQQLRFSVSGSTVAASLTVATVYAVVTTSGASGGVYDNGAHVYSDANPPETLMQTRTTEPAAPSSGLAVQYVSSTDGVQRTKTDTGLISRQITEAEYARILAVKPTTLINPVTIAANTNEQVLASAVIPANTVVAGTTYRVKIAGTASQSSAAAATQTARVRIGANSGAALSGAVAAVGAATTSAATKTTVPFEIDCLVTFRTAGTSGTAIGLANPSGPLWAGGAASTVSGVTSAVAAVGTVDMRMEVTIQSGTATVSGTVQVAAFEPIQP